MRTKTKKNLDTPRCRYNDGVVCNEQCHCAKCGWNPEVEKKRLRRFNGKRCIVGNSTMPDNGFPRSFGKITKIL